MTGLRTHRYLRLALVGIVVALAASVLIELIRSGGQPLPSISDYYYSPAGGVFVGALTAAGVALLVLSGRDTESMLLDIAAVFAPLIAIVPTGYRGEPSVPSEVLPTVRNGVGVYLTMVTILVALGIVLAARGDLAWRRVAIVGGTASAVVIALATLAFAPGPAAVFPFPGGINLHLVATVCFFAMFAAIPWVTSFGEDPPAAGYRRVYLAVSIVIAAALVTTVGAAIANPDTVGVLIGEAVALGAFAVYWTAQTIERWQDADPPSILPR
ncbi:hypothetical protein [Microbacterium oleivorans]|uniref:DUF998 domain-containing protein n=1 Tax=Microbacterium oleivorans TaxID=273677 RepID=A0A177KCX1_9MICO|nr:hypothetical protein [Microbacterium oleivorans]OAH51242.1 hypothetical protein AYL44_02955 [Microbacterium oleivorans]